MVGNERSGVTRWGKVQAWWLLHPGIDADRFCLLAALATYADDDGHCEPSQATLARHLKRSRPWVNRVVADLAAGGFLEKTTRSRRNGGTTSCLYRLADFPPTPGDAPVTPIRPAADSPGHRQDTSQPEPEQIQFPSRPNPHERHADAPGTERQAAGEPEQAGRKEGVPEGWRPSGAAIDAARLLSPETDVEAHAVMFSTRCRAKGYRYVTGRLDDAWLSWFAEDVRKGSRSVAARRTGEPGPYARPRHPTPAARADDRFAAWASSAAAPPTRHPDPWS